MLCIGYEVGNYEKVIDKAHLFYHLKLVLKLLFNAAVVVGIAAGKPLEAQPFQVRKAVRFALGQPKARQLVLAELEIVIAHFGDLRRVVGSLRMLRKQRAHLVLGLEVELLRFKFHARGVVDGFLHLNAHENILIIRVLLFDVVRVVGHGKGYAGLLMYAQKPL